MLKLSSSRQMKAKRKQSLFGSRGYRGSSKGSERSIRSLRSRKSVYSVRSRKSQVRSVRSRREGWKLPEDRSRSSMASQTSKKLSIIEGEGDESIVSAAVSLVDFMKGKYRFRALVRRVLINLAWLQEAFEEEGGEGVKWARAILRAKSRRRQEGPQIFTAQEKMLFNKIPEMRTKEEIDKAFLVVQRMNLFANYKEEVQRGLAARLHFRYITQHRNVIKQGHLPMALYFILQGDVLVSVTRKDPYSEEKITENVAILTGGDMFGEVALLQGITRTATVSTSTVCEFLTLSRDDFMSVLKKTLAAQWKRFANELSRFSYFDSLNEVQMREACILGRLRTFAQDQTILGDGCGTQEYAYFVLSGTCSLIQTLTVEMWEEFGDTVYRLLDDPTLVAVRHLPEMTGRARMPSIAVQDLAAQDEWNVVAHRLERAIGSPPTSMVWKKARAEVERVLEKEEPFKTKTVVHSDAWDKARLRVLETLGPHSLRAAAQNGSGSSSKEGSNESLLPRGTLRRRSTLGLNGGPTLVQTASPTTPPATVPSGPEAVHTSVLVDRIIDRRSSVTSSNGSIEGKGSPMNLPPTSTSNERHQPFLDAARASVLGRSASMSRPSNVSRFSTVHMTDGRPSVVPMPGFGPYGPALLRLAERAGAIGVGLRGMEPKSLADAPRPKTHKIEMVRGQRKRPPHPEQAQLKLDHELKHYPFKMNPKRHNTSTSRSFRTESVRSSLKSVMKSMMPSNWPSSSMQSTDSEAGETEELMKVSLDTSTSSEHRRQQGHLGRDPSGKRVKAFVGDTARTHTLKRKYAYEDPFRLTPKPRRLSLASRSGIRSAWLNAVNVLRETLDRCEEAEGDQNRIDIMVEFWRRARRPIERLMKKEHTPVVEPNHHIDCHFVQVCFFSPLAVFGIGECMEQRRIVAKNPVECLLLPRYWLDSINSGNVWDRVRLYLNRAIPDSKLVFRKWADERRWLRYRSHLVAEQINKRYVDSGTTPYDVPYSLRLSELSDPHARGYERRYVIREPTTSTPLRLTRRMSRSVI